MVDGIDLGKVIHTANHFHTDLDGDFPTAIVDGTDVDRDNDDATAPVPDSGNDTHTAIRYR